MLTICFVVPTKLVIEKKKWGDKESKDFHPKEGIKVLEQNRISLPR